MPSTKKTNHKSEKKEHQYLFVVVSLVVLVTAFIAFYYLKSVWQTLLLSVPQEQTTENITLEQILAPDDPFIGSENPKLTIIEFGDFECPACLSMAPILRQLVLDYQDQLRLVWKDFPGPSHVNAQEAALAARCAQAQGAFWPFHDTLFANQESLSRELYNKIAMQLGLNLPDFNNCLDTNAKIDLIGKSMEAGQLVDIDATPFILIGEYKISGAVSEESLRNLIMSYLK